MKIAIIDGIAAHYRLLLFQKLSQQTVNEYRIYASSEKYLGIETIDPRLANTPVAEGGINWTLIDNVTFFKRIIWQKDVLRIVSTGKFDAYIFIGEAQLISTWIGVLICRLKKKKVVFWGHGIYGNEKWLKRSLRHVFNKLPDAYLLYDERSKKLIGSGGVDENKLFVVNNSLNHDAHVSIRNSITQEELLILRPKLFPSGKDLPVIIFIGRLTPVKKIDQLISSVKILHKKGEKINCLIVGKGEEEPFLKDLVSSAGLNDFFNFYGPCYDERENALLLSLSDCCVSPGNAGLTAIHSMSFGTPVITHNDFPNQMPEAAAVLENITGELFEKDNIPGLSQKIEKIVFEKGKAHYSSNCINLIDSYYNPDYQVNVFNKMVEYLDKMS